MIEREEFELMISEKFGFNLMRYSDDFREKEKSGQYCDLKTRLVSVVWQEARKHQWTEIDYNRGDYGMPEVGRKVLIVAGGVQQDTIFEFRDKLDGEPCWNWFRDDLDECPMVEEGQHWCYAPQFGSE